MRNGAVRPIALALGVLFLTGSSAQAGPIVINDVIQITRNQNLTDLRVRSVTGGLIGPDSNVLHDAQSARTSKDTTSRGTSLLAGVVFAPDDQKPGVNIFEQGDVEGTICDCGEIPAIAGGFPKWPLLFLAAVPFFFIHNCDSCDIPSSTPTPTPPPTPPGPVPEPASILLLGSGLAAVGTFLRRRYSKADSPSGTRED